jgi:hypothetical protein
MIAAAATPTADCRVPGVRVIIPAAGVAGEWLVSRHT